MSLYEKASREADARLAELGKEKTTRKGGLLGGDTVNRPLPESCVLFRAELFCPKSAHWPSTGPHKTAWIDTPGYSQVFVKQRKWVGWKTRVDNLKSYGRLLTVNLY